MGASEPTGNLAARDARGGSRIQEPGLGVRTMCCLQNKNPDIIDQNLPDLIRNALQPSLPSQDMDCSRHVFLPPSKLETEVIPRQVCNSNGKRGQGPATALKHVTTPARRHSTNVYSNVPSGYPSCPTLQLPACHSGGKTFKFAERRESFSENHSQLTVPPCDFKAASETSTTTPLRQLSWPSGSLPPSPGGPTSPTPSSSGSDQEFGDIGYYQNVPPPAILPRQLATSRRVPPDVVGELASSSPSSRGSDKHLDASMNRLRESGFYFSSLAAHDAKQKLRKSQIGTFLVRDSADPMALCSISVKTHRGTTAIRVIYVNGYFRLDCDPTSVQEMPMFNCIMDLLGYYVNQSASDARNKCVFLESSGRRDTPVILLRPFREHAQSLKHLCRRSLHSGYSSETLARRLDSKEVPCSVQLRQYILNYPSCL